MSLSFSLTPSSCFGPRTGTLTLRRHGTNIVLSTPGLMAATSRGVVPHLSRDQYARSVALRWIHLPFESFLEISPPVPTLQPGPLPLHTFLGYNPSQHLICLTLRDPSNNRELPANGNDYVAASTSRGVRKITSAQWREYARACAPDIVVAMSDIPWTPPPFSQKRTTKSIERTAAWLGHLLAHGPPPLNVLVHMAGGISEPARRAFTDSLTETLHGKEAEAIAPHKCLDDGVAGYIFDLLPLRHAMDASSDITLVTQQEATVALFKASLEAAAPSKLRVVNSVASPHEILRLIRSVGIDVFDAHWAQDAAHVGVALDFVFPIQRRDSSGKRRDLGHNLYHTQYAHDFSSFTRSTCPCGACSPVASPTALTHSVLDTYTPTASPPSYSRAYVHHLLHTHEMSAHALLVMHNLAVLDAFFTSVRDVLQRGADFGAHVDEFLAEYDESLAVVAEASTTWKNVDVARGKGRLARERAGANE
ncbi:tRNA-guanine(15) transglycosylase-like protein [Mycena crocata]|nr:tRNA-guanine(15) transglycosylase-like protein [Mycena crocata]